MTFRTIIFWVAISIAFIALSYLINGLFFGEFTITWHQTLIGVLVGFFAGAFLDLFLSSLQAEA